MQCGEALQGHLLEGQAAGDLDEALDDALAEFQHRRQAAAVGHVDGVADHLPVEGVQSPLVVRGQVFPVQLADGLQGQLEVVVDAVQVVAVGVALLIQRGQPVVAFTVGDAPGQAAVAQKQHLHLLFVVVFAEVVRVAVPQP